MASFPAKPHKFFKNRKMPLLMQKMKLEVVHRHKWYSRGEKVISNVIWC